jgi:hypothetical protein
MAGVPSSDTLASLVVDNWYTITEMDGGDRKKVVGRLKDNPRQLGKG